jgi:TonB-linked SusC/RagA family outer membrane protein
MHNVLLKFRFTLIMCSAFTCTSGFLGAQQLTANLDPTVWVPDASFTDSREFSKIRSLSDVFAELERIFQVSFAYDSEVIENMTMDISTLDMSGKSLTENLRSLPPILAYYEVSNSVYAIFKKKKEMEAKSPFNGRPKASGTSVLVGDFNISDPIARLSVVVAQGTSVSGTVTSGDDGSPLPGVNVIVKGTTVGTTTDLNGKYALQLTDDQKTLIFSFIGYESQEVEVGGRTVIDLVLQPDVQTLSEVVVVGYGVQKKANLTGSVSQIDSEAIEMRSVNSTTQALQGLAPNLNIDVNSSGGSADASMNINVRGIGSTSSSNPYILIDGVRATQAELSNLNPDVIQSISVLKDAASAAIYGAQAAYGVILIETKKGKKGQDFKLTYSSDFRWNKRIFVPPSVNTVEYARVLNDASKNYSGQVAFGDEQMELIRAYNAGELSYETMADPDNPNHWLGIQSGTSDGWFSGFANNDWWDIMYKDLGFTQKHNVAVSGGGEKFSYHVSGGIFNDGGQLRYGDENENYTRANLNTNFNVDVTDWLKVSSIIRYFQEENIFPATLEGGSRGRLYHDIMRFSPLAPKKTPAVLDADGNVIVPEQLTLMAGWNEKNGFNTYNVNNLVSTLRAEISLTKDWTIKGDYTFKRDFYDRTLNLKKWTLIGPDAQPSLTYQANNNQIAKEINKTNYTTFNIYSQYSKSIQDAHNLELLVGYQQEENTFSGLEVSRQNVIADDLNSLNIAIGDVIGPNNPINTWSTLGAFGRFQYNFKEKYLLEFNGRYDGSSKFAEGHRFGFFPSVSAGYNIHEEGFWNSLSSAVNTLKLRASWGKLGNQDVGRVNDDIVKYLYLSNIPISDRLNWVIDGARPIYTSIPGIVSPNITWETSVTKNIGADLSFLRNRLTASVDVYERETNNMFGPSGALPNVLGANPPETNSASLKTTGWELVLGWRDQKRDFNYNATFMLSDNKTVITEYHNPEKVLSNYYVGQQIGEIWGYEANDLFQSQAEVDAYLAEVNLNHLGTNWQAGNVKYIDSNGDGKVDVGANTLEDHGDLRVIGNEAPRYRVSLMAGASWRNFDFNIFFQGVMKRDYWIDSYGTLFWGWNSRGHSRVTEATLDYWSEENPDAYLPIPLEAGGRSGFAKDRHPSTRYLQNASFIRLKNMGLGYTLPSSLTQKLKINRMRVFVNGENLLTFSKLWENFDPELVSTGTRSRTSVGRAYPLAQTYAIGADITF